MADDPRYYHCAANPAGIHEPASVEPCVLWTCKHCGSRIGYSVARGLYSFLGLLPDSPPASSTPEPDNGR